MLVKWSFITESTKWFFFWDSAITKWGMQQLKCSPFYPKTLNTSACPLPSSVPSPWTLVLEAPHLKNRNGWKLASWLRSELSAKKHSAVDIWKLVMSWQGMSVTYWNAIHSQLNWWNKFPKGIIKCMNYDNSLQYTKKNSKSPTHDMNCKSTKRSSNKTVHSTIQ